MAFMMVYFNRTTNLSLSAIGFSIAMGRALSSIVPVFIGRLLDKIGPKKISILGDFISGCGFILCIFAKDPLTIMLTQFFTQAGAHIFWTCNRGLVSLASKGEGIHIWFGLISSIRNVGLGLGTIISSLAFSNDSIDNLFFIIFASASLYFLSCITLLVWRPDGSVFNGNNVEKNNTTIKSVLFDRKYRSLLFVNLGLVLSAMVIPLVIVIYSTQQLGLPPFFSGFLIFLNTAMVSILSAHVASWTKNHDSILNIKWSYVLNILSFMIFWGAGFIINQHQVLVFSIMVLAMVIYSIAEMISSPSANFLSIDLAPKVNNGSYMAAFQMTWSIGMTVTPAIIGWLMDINKHATWSALILVMVFIFLFGFKVFKRDING